MVDRLVSVDASTYRFPAAVRTQLGVELQTPGSEVGAALRAAAPRFVAAGTYAARPAASSVSAGSRYNATNVLEQYESNGTAWSVVGAGGNELAYAQSTTIFSVYSTTLTDVTGLTVTFVVGERPIEILMDVDIANEDATFVSTAAIVLDGTVRARLASPANGADRWSTEQRRVRVTGLTPGSTHTAKVQLASSGAAKAARVTGDSTNPMSIQVVTL